MRKLFKRALVILGLVAFAAVLFAPTSAKADQELPTFYDMFKDIEKVPSRAHTRNPMFTNTAAVDSIVESGKTYAVTVQSVTLDGVSVLDLYDFTKDIRNDLYWFPFVTDVQLVSGDGESLGTVWQETFNIGGNIFVNNVEVIQHIPTVLSLVSSNGDFANDGLISWEETETGSKLKTHGILPLPPGYTLEAVEHLIELAYQNLLNHFGTTGEISVEGQLITTP